MNKQNYFVLVILLLSSITLSAQSTSDRYGIRLVPADYKTSGVTPKVTGTKRCRRPQLLTVRVYRLTQSRVYDLGIRGSYYWWINGEFLEGHHGSSLSFNADNEIKLKPGDIVEVFLKSTDYPYWYFSNTANGESRVTVQPRFKGNEKPKITIQSDIKYATSSCDFVDLSVRVNLDYDVYLPANDKRNDLYCEWFVGGQSIGKIFYDPANFDNFEISIDQALAGPQFGEEISCKIYDGCMPNSSGEATMGIPSLVSPPKPPIVDHTLKPPNCSLLTIKFSESPPPNEEWYWQSSPSSCDGPGDFGLGSSGVRTVSSGTYYLRAYDADNKCWSTECSEIFVRTEPVANAYQGGIATCKTCSDGAIDFYPNGGTPPYFFSTDGGINWTSTPDEVVTISELSPGPYLCKVKDNNGCESQIAYLWLGYKMPMDALPNDHPSFEVSDPINVATGAYKFQNTDINIPSIGGGLNFFRHYNSINSHKNSDLGYGWSHSYDYRIVNVGDSLWNVHHGDGHIGYYTADTNGKPKAVWQGVYEELVFDKTLNKYQLEFKTGTAYHFNDVGRLDSIVDLNGNKTQLTYSNGKLSQIKAPGGRNLKLSYDSNKLVQITNPIGWEVNYRYDTIGNLISVLDPENQVTHFLYDSFHRITTVIQPSGDTLLVNVYNKEGKVVRQEDAFRSATILNYVDYRLTTITYPDLSQTEIVHDNYFRHTYTGDESQNSKYTSYDDNHNPYRVDDENGTTTFASWDTTGNITEVLYPDNNGEFITYNTLNKPTRYVNVSNDTTNFFYDTTGNLLSIQLPDKTSELYHYTPEGLLDTLENSLGHKTTLSYNSFGDITSINSPTETLKFDYNLIGLITSITDENNNVTKITYNKRGQILTFTDPFTQRISYAYDKNGNQTSVIDKNGYVTSFVYDKKNRLIETILPNGGKTKLTYDSRDNLINVVNPNNHKTNYYYNNRQELVGIKDAFGFNSLFRDPAGQIIGERDATGVESSYVYDNRGRVINITNGLAETLFLAYNAVGQNASISDQLGRRTEYDYSNMGHLQKVTDAHNNQTIINNDALGNVLSITDPNGHTQYNSYDVLSRLVSHRDASGWQDSFVYDPAGNLTKWIKETGTIYTKYDALNQPIEVSLSNGDTYKFTYDPNGNLVSFGNQAGTAYFTYNNMNWPVTFVDVFGDTVKYTYDLAGNRTSIKYPDAGTVQYIYDAANRLDSVIDWNGYITTYRYDAAGRMLLIAGHGSDTTFYNYNNAGRLIEKTCKIQDSIIYRSKLTLDAAGQIVNEERTGPVPANLNEQSFSYNYLDNDVMSSNGQTSFINDSAGNRRSDGGAFDYSVDNLLLKTDDARYNYDALGNRVGKITTSGTTNYLNDLTGRLSQILQERDASGKLLASYVYGDGLLSRIDSKGKTIFYHFDVQQNTVAISNDSGKVTDTYTYEPFGKVVEHKGGTNQPFTFMGELGVQQENENIYYVRARYYDALNQRFLSKDPYPANVINPQTLNRFAYATNNPISFIDPTGLYGEKDNNGEHSCAVEGSGYQKMLLRREKIAQTAEGYIGSKDWNYSVAKSNFGNETNKCNLFVYDIITEAGASPGLPNTGHLVKFLFTREGYPPTAAQWSDQSYNIPCWSVTNSPERGDVVSWPYGGYSDATGHVAIVVGNGNSVGTSGSLKSVGKTRFGFDGKHKPITYRRFNCYE